VSLARDGVAADIENPAIYLEKLVQVFLGLKPSHTPFDQLWSRTFIPSLIWNERQRNKSIWSNCLPSTKYLPATRGLGKIHSQGKVETQQPMWNYLKANLDGWEICSSMEK
jgi:hypothetical protein